MSPGLSPATAQLTAFPQPGGLVYDPDRRRIER